MPLTQAERDTLIALLSDASNYYEVEGETELVDRIENIWNKLADWGVI